MFIPGIIALSASKYARMKWRSVFFIIVLWCWAFVWSHACLCFAHKHPQRTAWSFYSLSELSPSSLRWRVQRRWTRRCRSPCWWRSSLPHCCSREQKRKRRWCSSACGGRWRAASAGTPAGRGRATRTRTRCPDVPERRQPQTWRQTLGTNGGKSRPSEWFPSHSDPPERPSLTSWLTWEEGETKEKHLLQYEQKSTKRQL